MPVIVQHAVGGTPPNPVPKLVKLPSKISARSCSTSLVRVMRRTLGFLKLNTGAKKPRARRAVRANHPGCKGRSHDKSNRIFPVRILLRTAFLRDHENLRSSRLAGPPISRHPKLARRRVRAREVTISVPPRLRDLREPLMTVASSS